MGLKPFSILYLVTWGVPALLMLRFGLWFCLAALFGHCELDLSGTSLCRSERVGYLRWSKTWRLAQLRELEIGELFQGSPKDDGTSVRPSRGLNPSTGPRAPSLAGTTITVTPSSELNALTGRLEGGRQIIIAVGYPHALLAALVEDLSTRIKAALSPQDGAGATAAGEFAEIPPTLRIRDLTVKSAGSVARPTTWMLSSRRPRQKSWSNRLPRGSRFAFRPWACGEGARDCFHSGSCGRF